MKRSHTAPASELQTQASELQRSLSVQRQRREAKSPDRYTDVSNVRRQLELPTTPTPTRTRTTTSSTTATPKTPKTPKTTVTRTTSTASTTPAPAATAPPPRELTDEEKKKIDEFRTRKTIIADSRKFHWHYNPYKDGDYLIIDRDTVEEMKKYEETVRPPPPNGKDEMNEDTKEDSEDSEDDEEEEDGYEDIKEDSKDEEVEEDGYEDKREDIEDEKEEKKYTEGNPYNHRNQIAVLDLEWVTYQVPLSKSERKQYDENKWKEEPREPAKRISEICAISIDGKTVFNQYVYYRPLHRVWRQIQQKHPNNIILDPNDDPSIAKKWPEVVELFCEQFEKGTIFYYQGTKDESSIKDNIKIWHDDAYPPDVEKKIKEKMEALWKAQEYIFVPVITILKELIEKSGIEPQTAKGKTVRKIRLHTRKLHQIYQYMFIESLLTITEVDSKGNKKTNIAGNWKVMKFINGFFRRTVFDSNIVEQNWEFERFGKHAFNYANNVIPYRNRIHFQQASDKVSVPIFHTAHTDAHILRHILLAMCMFVQLERRIIKLVKPYYDIEVKIEEMKATMLGIPVPPFPTSLENFAFACFMTAFTFNLDHLRIFYVGCSQVAAHYLFKKGDERRIAKEKQEKRAAAATTSTKKKKTDPSAEGLDPSEERLPRLERDPTTTSTTTTPTVLFAGASDHFPFQRNSKRLANDAIDNALSQNFYDDYDGQFYFRDFKEFRSKVQQQVDAFYVSLSTNGETVERICDGPLWMVLTSLTNYRDETKVSILHCYHCPSLHQTTKLTLVDFEKKSYLQSTPYQLAFCKLCKKYEGLTNKQQNVIHEGIQGERECNVEHFRHNHRYDDDDDTDDARLPIYTINEHQPPHPLNFADFKYKFKFDNPNEQQQPQQPQQEQRSQQTEADLIHAFASLLFYDGEYLMTGSTKHLKYLQNKN